jgi:hypothetical protein
MTELVLAAFLGACCAVIAFLVAEKAELLRQHVVLRKNFMATGRRAQRLVVSNRRRAVALKRMRARLKHWQQFSAALEEIATREARACGEVEGRADLYAELLHDYKEMERTASKLAGRLAAQEEMGEIKEVMSRLAEALARLRR